MELSPFSLDSEPDCATSVPTFAIASVIIGILNLGWKSFSIETDPVRLWVAPGSETAVQKDHFDSNFGPFFRPQQIFITAASPASHRVSENQDSGNVTREILSLPEPSEPAMTFDRLEWWLEHEQAITSLKSTPNGYTFQDVCFSPAGPGTPCVIQSVSAWFGGYLDEDTWEETIEDCAASPAQCLPDYGQPLDPKIILGGINEDKSWKDAKSMIVTFVVNGSLDKKILARTEEWERTLRAYLDNVSHTAREDASAWISYSTGVSLEEELNKSTNTDYKTVIASYLLMFLYISLTLGGGNGTGRALLFGEDGIFPSLWDKIVQIPVLLHLQRAPASPDPGWSSSTSVVSPSRRLRTRMNRLIAFLPTLLSVNSKFTLGLFGIAMVVIAISTSVGLFSMLGVKVTLIIAEVIPFLVLAVGVDNIFILVHELDRQNALHGPGASAASAAHANGIQHLGGDSFADDLDIDDGEEDGLLAPSHLSPEERVARALARMGPSILLSAVTETVAFALGALVPMPAVRNFALYAAGSVALDAVLQVTVFVSAMTLDLKRVEVSETAFAVQDAHSDSLLPGDSDGLLPLRPASASDRSLRHAEPSRLERGYCRAIHSPALCAVPPQKGGKGRRGHCICWSLCRRRHGCSANRSRSQCVGRLLYLDSTCISLILVSFVS